MGGEGRGLACQWLIMGGWADRQGQAQGGTRVNINNTHSSKPLQTIIARPRKKLKGRIMFSSSRFLGHDCHLGHHGGVERGLVENGGHHLERGHTEVAHSYTLATYPAPHSTLQYPSKEGGRPKLKRVNLKPAR